MRTGNINCRPGPVKINLGDKVDIFKLRPRTITKNCRLGPVSRNWGPRPVKKILGPRPVKLIWGLGVRVRDGGEAKDQGPGNAKTLIETPNNSVFHNLQNDFTTEIT